MKCITRYKYERGNEGELESKIHHKLQLTLKELQPQRRWSNISHRDKKTIKELKEKNYVCLPSDKDTEFCVIQQDTCTLHVGQDNREQSQHNLEKHLHTKSVTFFCPKELHRLKHRSAQILPSHQAPQKPAYILKYDPLYLTPMDQPNASHGCSQTLLNQS